MRSSSTSDSQQIKKGRILLLIAIALILVFVVSGFLGGLKGQAISEMVMSLATWALLCVFLYRGSNNAKGCLGGMLTFLGVGLSFAILVLVACLTVPDMMRKEVPAPGLIGAIKLLGLFFGLIYCWWALLFSKSVKAFQAFQRSNRK